MTKLYCITRDKLSTGTDAVTAGLLKTTCKKQGIKFVPIYSQNYDFSKPNILEPGSILYKVTTDTKSTILFKLLLNKNISTVFKDYKIGLMRGSPITGPLLLQENGLPMIKSIFDIPSDKKLLSQYVNKLDSFPIIIKAIGGSHGVGVMRVDSMESLVSIVDYLNSLSDSKNYILRSYIDHESSARLIVLDNKVIDSISYKRGKQDFRSNAGTDLVVSKKQFSQTIQNNAIKAVNSYGSDFGGVDILIDKKGKGHIAEVNIPCFFPRSQIETGVDIAGELVSFLLKKAEKLA